VSEGEGHVFTGGGLDPEPGLPGWWRWPLGEGLQFGAILEPLSLQGGNGRARLRMVPSAVHRNLRGSVHGGALMSFVDMALFAACYVNGLRDGARGTTLDCSVQFIGPASEQQPVIADVEVLRETGRLVFLRGLLVQGEPEQTVASFTGTIRKAPRRNPA